MIKKLLLAAAVIFCLTLAACEKSTDQDLYTVQFPAYTLENPQSQPYIDIINSTKAFTVSMKIPGDWEIKAPEESKDNEKDLPEDLLPLGEFYTPLYIYENEKLIGYIGFDRFEPYPNEDEIAKEDYYKTVYPKLRLPSIFHWDPYTPIVTTANGETGIADVLYKDPKELNNSSHKSMAEIPELETVGILSYDKILEVYIGIAFCPDTVDQQQVEAIAKSVRLSPSN